MRDGTFEYLPIPDNFGGRGVDERTYGNSLSRTGQPLISYFPERRRVEMHDKPMHFDPEFENLTYGDPVRAGPKRGLAKLERGDMLVFYAGLEGFDFVSPRALYIIIGYFEIVSAGFANDFSVSELGGLFGENFHVRHRAVLEEQRDRLILIKGGAGSRLLLRAVRISSLGKDSKGKPLQRLSSEMQQVFGHFNGHTAIQRSTPRWVLPDFTEHAADFVRAIE